MDNVENKGDCRDVLAEGSKRGMHLAAPFVGAASHCHSVVVAAGAAAVELDRRDGPADPDRGEILSDSACKDSPSLAHMAS